MRLTFLQVYIHVWKHLEKGLQGYTSTVNGVGHSKEGGLRGGKRNFTLSDFCYCCCYSEYILMYYL